jgi:hypothetical protein
MAENSNVIQFPQINQDAKEELKKELGEENYQKLKLWCDSFRHHCCDLVGATNPNVLTPFEDCELLLLAIQIVADDLEMYLDAVQDMD